MQSIKNNLQKSLNEFHTSREDVLNSNYNDYTSNLIRFISLINKDPYISKLLKSALPEIDFENWYQNGISSVTSMVGSGKLDWPKDRKELIATQKELFESFINDKETPQGFCSKFVGRIDSLNDCVYKINQLYFKPFSRDLAKLIQDEHENICNKASTINYIANTAKKYGNCICKNVGKIIIGLITSVLAAAIIKYYI